ncbi:MAG: DUF1700 domain-containing protein [Clostridia bacterium]|nr:DUF1700 domain-containing protein [Clostridia bacterium]
MTKEMYIKDLRNYLEGIPEADIEEAVSDIEEYFANGISSGRSEDAIASALLTPKELAYSIKAEYNINSISTKNSFKKTFVILSSLLSLGLMNLILLPIFFAVALLVLSFYLTIGCLYFTGVLLFIAPILKMIAPAFVSMSAGVPMIVVPIIGIGVVMVTYVLHQLLNKLSKKSYLFLLKYFKLHSAIC